MIIEVAGPSLRGAPGHMPRSAREAVERDTRRPMADQLRSNRQGLLRWAVRDLNEQGEGAYRTSPAVSYRGAAWEYPSAIFCSSPRCPCVPRSARTRRTRRVAAPVIQNDGHERLAHHGPSLTNGRWGR